MNKIVNGVANDYEFSQLENTTANYYQVMERYYTEDFVRKQQEEIDRLNNIIQDTKEVLLTTNNVEKALNILDRKGDKE